MFANGGRIRPVNPSVVLMKWMVAALLGIGALLASTSAHAYCTSGCTKTCFYDQDGDGYGGGTGICGMGSYCDCPPNTIPTAGDCNDNNANVHPGAAETCNGVDDNCNGSVDENLTRTCGQSTGMCQTGTETCSSGSWGSCQGAVGPSTEVCDGKDNDCDGLTDENVKNTYYRDADGDHYGDPSKSTLRCSAPSGYVANSNDCDDSKSSVHPGATELCNGINDDCDAQIDEGFPNLGNTCYAGTGECRASGRYVCNASGSGTTCNATPGSPTAETCNNRDDDCDGQVDDHLTRTCGSNVGVCSTGTETCSAGSWGSCQGNVGPSSETCDGKDNDCDGTIDNGVKTTFYLDSDGDGHGDSTKTTQACGVPNGYVTNHDDCDDSRGSVHPGATEDCGNGIDDNCDGKTDGADATCDCTDGDTQACYTGASGTEGVGVCAAGTQTCVNGSFGACTGEVTPTSETCDGQDDDCDGTVDNGVKTTFYADSDGDGHGDSTQTTQACGVPNGYVTNHDDCDDARSSVHPGATEDCGNGIDDNCDGKTDGADATCDCTDGDTQACYTGASGTEGVGVCAAGTQTCVNGSFGACTGEVTPTAETCDGQDDDCDGTVDNGVKTTFYADSDGDGFGDATSTKDACSAPADYVADNTDCDDTAGAVNPGAIEDCGNGVDDDCDGKVDGADSDCNCTDGDTQACYSGPAGTEGVGACAGGTQTCASGAFGACDGEVTPTDEVCNGVDDDCNGTVDDNATDCSSDEVCYMASCVPACTNSTECSGGNRCYPNPGRCTDDPCAGVTCADGQSCYQGSCFDDCTSDADCSGGDTCFDGRCAANSCEGVQCAVEDVCVDGTCKTSCSTQDDCPSGICRDGHCATGPCDGVDCGASQVCYGGTCFDKCSTDAECTGDKLCLEGQRCAEANCDMITCRTGETCYRGVCYPGCTDDSSCASDQRCYQGACVAKDQCTSGDCDAGSADAGPVDAGASDAGATDTGAVDAGAADSGRKYHHQVQSDGCSCYSADGATPDAPLALVLMFGLGAGVFVRRRRD